MWIQKPSSVLTTSLQIDEQKSELIRKDALLESLQREVKDSSQPQTASNRYIFYDYVGDNYEWLYNTHI